MAWFADKQEVVDCATRTIRQQRETIQEQDAKIKALESELNQWKHAVGHLLSAVPVSEIVGVGGSITDLANWMKARHKDATKIKALQRGNIAMKKRLLDLGEPLTPEYFGAISDTGETP